MRRERGVWERIGSGLSVFGWEAAIVLAAAVFAVAVAAVILLIV